MDAVIGPSHKFYKVHKRNQEKKININYNIFGPELFISRVFNNVNVRVLW